MNNLLCLDVISCCRKPKEVVAKLLLLGQLTWQGISTKKALRNSTLLWHWNQQLRMSYLDQLVSRCHRLCYRTASLSKWLRLVFCNHGDEDNDARVQDRSFGLLLCCKLKQIWGLCYFNLVWWEISFVSSPIPHSHQQDMFMGIRLGLTNENQPKKIHR